MELLLPGQIVAERYRIDGFGNSGGQGFTLWGSDIEAPEERPWEKDVLLKQYHDLVVGSPEAQEVKRHFDTLNARLRGEQHYVCLPKTVVESSNSIIAVFPRITGRTLCDVMEEGLSEAMCVRFAQALANVLRVLHKAGVVHADLKPANVMVEEIPNRTNTFIRLIDLDSALIDGRGVRVNPLKTHLYESPEHLAPSRYGPISDRSDVFTLGIMLSELLFKQHPFDDVEDYAQAVSEEAFTLPDSAYHVEVVSILERCLLADPEQRPSAAQVHGIIHERIKQGLRAIQPALGWRQAYRLPRPQNPPPQLPAASSPKFSSHELCPKPVWQARAASSPSIQLLLEGDPPFKRVYYTNVVLGRNQFRGAGLSSLPTGLLSLDVRNGTWAVTLLTPATVSVSGEPLEVNRSRTLKTGDKLCIDDKVLSVDVGTVSGP